MERENSVSDNGEDPVRRNHSQRSHQNSFYSGRRRRKWNCKLYCDAFVMLLPLALAALVVFQIYYNILGAASLGGKYESFKWFLYRVGSLLPGVVIGVDLGIRGLRKVEYRWLKVVSKVISILYLATFECFWLYYLYVCLPSYHYQSTRQVIVSYRDAIHF